jgi:serine/threonine protein kinase
MNKNQERQDHPFGLPQHVTLTLSLYEDKFLHEYLAKDDNLDRDVLIQIVKDHRIKKLLHDWDNVAKRTEAFLSSYESGTIAQNHEYFAYQIDKTEHIYSLTDIRSEISMLERITLFRSILEIVDHLHRSNYIYGCITPDRFLVFRESDKPLYSVMMRPPSHFAEVGFDLTYQEANLEVIPESALQIMKALYSRGFSQITEGLLTLFDKHKPMDAWIYSTLNPYIAPEHTIEKTKFSDLYSLGILFFWLLNGSVPDFDIEKIEISETEMSILQSASGRVRLYRFLENVILQKLLLPSDWKHVPETFQRIIKKSICRTSGGYKDVKELCIAIDDLFAPRQKIVVTDKHNHPVEKADILLTDAESKEQILHGSTNAQGHATFDNLLKRTYLLAVTKDRFESFKTNLEPRVTNHLNIQLESKNKSIFDEIIRKFSRKPKNEK